MRSRPVAGTTLIDKDAGKVDFAVRQLVSLAVGHEVLRHNRLASRRGASGAREGGSGVAPYLSSGGAYSDNWQTACRARRSTSRAKVAPEPRSVWNLIVRARIITTSSSPISLRGIRPLIRPHCPCDRCLVCGARRFRKSRAAEAAALPRKRPKLGTRRFGRVAAAGRRRRRLLSCRCCSGRPGGAARVPLADGDAEVREPLRQAPARPHFMRDGPRAPAGARRFGLP